MSIRQEGEPKIYDLNFQLLQPWSVPVFKTTLPPDVLQTMIEISDQIITDKEAISHGYALQGQIDSELEVELDILEQTGMMGFFMGAVRQFIIQCKVQRCIRRDIDAIQREEWLTQITNMWIISQQPGEYNPLHCHPGCQISTVMYLKVPKILSSRKEHSPDDDGSILFASNSSTDFDFCVSNIVIPPQVGDFYIFGANQQHAVYPYRCEEGQKDVERRSISFNAVFQSKSAYMMEELTAPIDNLLKEKKFDEALKLAKNTDLEVSKKNLIIKNLEKIKRTADRIKNNPRWPPI